MPRRTDCWIALLLTASVWLAYLHVLGHEFVNYDDEAIYRNYDHGPSLAGVLWALFETQRAQMWHPLTWWSLFLDELLYGAAPWGYHLTNLLLHNANTLLVFAVLCRATGAAWRSAAVAAFFALHPLHVESVAWVSERKDVLCTFFYLLAILAYLSYAARPRRDRYLLLMLAFAAAILSKPMAVTLPCTLLLLDYWPLRRFPGQRVEADHPWQRPRTAKRLLVEKTPLLAMSAAVSILTVAVMEREGVLRSLDEFSLGRRAALAVMAYATYLWQMVWPVRLAPFYPTPTPFYSAAEIASAATLLAGISAIAWMQAKRRPYLLVGWCWYLGILFPVCGIVKFASFAHADRFTYLPLVGIFLALVWLASEWNSVLGQRVVSGVCVTLLGVCLAATRAQVMVWRDSVTLWTHALEAGHDNFVTRHQLADALQSVGRPRHEVLPHVQAAARLAERPDDLVRLAHRLQTMRDLDGALASLRKAAALRPAHPLTHERLAEVLAKRGEHEEAARQRDRAKELRAQQRTAAGIE
jgi:hypothetical protein